MFRVRSVISILPGARIHAIALRVCMLGMLRTLNDDDWGRPYGLSIVPGARLLQRSTVLSAVVFRYRSQLYRCALS